MEILPEDLARELSAPPQWVEEGRWYLPHRVRGNVWLVDQEHLHIWASAWEQAQREDSSAQVRAAA
jgi:hypothetical protein